MLKATVGDIGTIIEAEITESGAVLGVSAATGMTILVTRPDGTTESLAGSFTTDGTDGKIYGLSTVDTFTLKGAYIYDPVFTLGGWSGSSTHGIVLKVRLRGTQ